MSADNEYKKILLEANLHEEKDELSSLLKELSREPHRYGRVEPPAGYENSLMAALKTRLPLETPKAVAAGDFEARKWNIFTSRRLAWSFSGAMAAFVAVLAFQSIRHVEAPATDFLMQTAQKGNAEAVERWLSSVNDSGIQVQVIQVDELSKADPQAANEALDAVAASLGVRKGI